MAGTATPIYPQTVMNWAVQILNADSTNKKTLATGGTNGTKIECINVQSTDSAAKTLNVFLSDGTTDYQITQVNIPANSGNATTTVPVDLFRHTQFPNLCYDANGNKYFYLKASWILKFAVTAAVTTALQINITASGGEF